jgi:hypothetical protein
MTNQRPIVLSPSLHCGEGRAVAGVKQTGVYACSRCAADSITRFATCSGTSS